MAAVRYLGYSKVRIFNGQGWRGPICVRVPNFVANFAKPLPKYGHFSIFGRPFVKRFALCYRTVVCPDCLSACPVCNVGVYCGQTVGWNKMKLGVQVGLGPGHIVLDGDPVLSSQKGGIVFQFSAHVYCSKTAGWIEMALGTEVGLRPGHLFLDIAQLPLRKTWAHPPPNFRPMSIVAKGLDGSRCNLVWR